MGTHQPRNNRSTDQKEKVDLDWSHNEKKQNCNNQTGTDMEPTGQTGERSSQEHLEKKYRARIQGGGADVAIAGEDGPRQTRVEVIHRWPMFLKEYKGLSK